MSYVCRKASKEERKERTERKEREKKTKAFLEGDTLCIKGKENVLVKFVSSVFTKESLLPKKKEGDGGMEGERRDSCYIICTTKICSIRIGCSLMERENKRETETETDRQTKRERERQRETDTQTDRQGKREKKENEKANVCLFQNFHSESISLLQTHY